MLANIYIRVNKTQLNPNWLTCSRIHLKSLTFESNYFSVNEEKSEIDPITLALLAQRLTDFSFPQFQENEHNEGDVLKKTNEHF
jgi:hypothetical protein